MSYFLKAVVKDIGKATIGERAITCDLSIPKMVLSQAAKMAPAPDWTGWSSAGPGVLKSAGPFGTALDAATELVFHDGVTAAVAGKVGATGALKRLSGALYRFDAGAVGSFALDDCDTLGLLQISDGKHTLDVEDDGVVTGKVEPRIGRLAIFRHRQERHVLISDELHVRYFVVVRWGLR